MDNRYKKIASHEQFWQLLRIMINVSKDFDKPEGYYFGMIKCECKCCGEGISLEKKTQFFFVWTWQQGKSEKEKLLLL